MSFDTSTARIRSYASTDRIVGELVREACDEVDHARAVYDHLADEVLRVARLIDPETENVTRAMALLHTAAVRLPKGGPALPLCQPCALGRHSRCDGTMGSSYWGKCRCQRCKHHPAGKAPDDEDAR